MRKIIVRRRALRTCAHSGARTQLPAQPGLWYHSHGTFVQKRAILTACLRKVQKMASTRALLIQSGKSKIREFQKLAYPNSVLKGVCTFLAATTGNDAWIAVRNTIR